MRDHCGASNDILGHNYKRRHPQRCLVEAIDEREKVRCALLLLLLRPGLIEQFRYFDSYTEYRKLLRDTGEALLILL